MPIQAPAQNVSVSHAPRLREATFDDYAQIASLQVQRGMRARSREEWVHLWINNPAYIDRQGRWPIGWVLEAGGNIVGYVGNIPVNYELNGRRLTAGSGHSWVVAPAYCSFSLLLMDQYLRQESADLCVSTSANALSYKAHVALGARPVPVGIWDRSSVWITNFSGFVSSWLERKKWPMSSWLSYPISAALIAGDSLFMHQVHKKGNGNRNVAIECCSDFDETFDSFWEILRAENPHILLADRSRRTLAWHFHYALRDGKAWIATAKTGSCLCAYAIFVLDSAPNDGAKRMVFVDFQAVAGKATLFYPILQWALERCRAEGIHLLQTAGLCPKGVGDVSLLAPHHVRQSAWPYLYKACDRNLVKILSNPDVWMPSLFDGNSSL